TGVASFIFIANDACLFHQFERTFPEVQMQNVRLARQQVIPDVESFHRIDDALNVSSPNVVSQVSCRIVTRLESVQYVVAELRLFGIHRSVRIAIAIEETDARVKIPT